MTDLKFKILTFVHDPPENVAPGEIEVINHFSDAEHSPSQVQEAIRELLSVRYLTGTIAGDKLYIQSPNGVLALETEIDLRRKEHIAQQQAETQLRKEAEQHAAHENERKRDRHVMLLSAFIGAGGAILGGLFTALAEYVLPRLFGS